MERGYYSDYGKSQYNCRDGCLLVREDVGQSRAWNPSSSAQLHPTHVLLRFLRITLAVHARMEMQL